MVHRLDERFHLLVHKASGVTQAKQLDGASICVSPGSSAAVNIQDYLGGLGVKFTLVTINNTAQLDKTLNAKTAALSETSTGDPVRVASGGVVIRGELFDRLNGAGRVTEVSGPAAVVVAALPAKGPPAAKFAAGSFTT